MNLSDQTILNVTMLGALVEAAHDTFGITPEMLFSPEQLKVIAEFVGSLPDDNDELTNRGAVLLVTTIREIGQRVMQEAQKQSGEIQ